MHWADVRDVNGRIVGWGDIAKVLRVSERTARTYAARPRDPLRVRYLDGAPYVRRDVLVRFRERMHGNPGLEVVRGSSEIRRKLRKDLGTCSWPRYSRLVTRDVDPLPVENLTGARVPGCRQREAWIYLDAYRDWLHANDVPYLARLAMRSMRRAGHATSVRTRR